MAERVREREDKYVVEPDWVMPSLDATLSDGARVEHDTVALSSMYYDTAHHALLRSGVTLRRRTGDADTGWQLKMPAGVARTEVRVPSARPGRTVPRELQRMLGGIRHGADLQLVATIDTERHRTRIVDAEGTLQAEVADDHVTAVATGAEARTVHLARGRGRTRCGVGEAAQAHRTDAALGRGHGGRRPLEAGSGARRGSTAVDRHRPRPAHRRRRRPDLPRRPVRCVGLGRPRPAAGRCTDSPDPGGHPPVSKRPPGLRRPVRPGARRSP